MVNVIMHYVRQEGESMLDELQGKGAEQNCERRAGGENFEMCDCVGQ